MLTSEEKKKKKKEKKTWVMNNDENLAYQCIFDASTLSYGNGLGF